MKKLFFTTALITLTLIAFSQHLATDWVTQFDRVSSYSSAHSATIDNNKYLVIYGDKYYEFDNNGDSIKAGTADFGLDETKVMALNGSSIFIGGVKNRKPAIAKLDLNYDTVWTSTLPLGNFTRGISALYFEGSDIYVGGSFNSSSPFIAKLDNMGDTLWTLVLKQSTFSNFSSILKLADGNFLASGNLDDYPLAAKFDANGDTIWTYQRNLFISFQQSNAFERSNGEIVLVPERKFITLDANGKEKSVIDLHSNFYDLHEENDTLYFSGSKDNMPYVESRTKALDSLSSVRLTENIAQVNGGGVFNSVTACIGGGFIAAGRARDSVNISANTWNVKLAKFNGGSVSNPGDTSKPKDTTTVHVQVRKDEFFSIYPNPANNVIIVEAERITDVQLYNSLGQNMEAKLNHRSIDVSTLEDGVYILRVDTENSIHTERIVIRH